jgi:hypothetical protein
MQDESFEADETGAGRSLPLAGERLSFESQIRARMR